MKPDDVNLKTYNGFPVDIKELNLRLAIMSEFLIIKYIFEML